MGKLYYGDNLKILEEKIADESVDLIYLDPPFSSNANYNLLFKEKTGEQSKSQIRAFTDTWEWGIESRKTLDYLVTGDNVPPEVSNAIRSIVDLLKTNDLSAYLVMMTVRLLELHRVLKKTGSLYLHCDPTASHYLKVILDAIFKPVNFRNEITWQRTFAHNDPKKYGNVADVILFYTKTEDYTWNVQYTPYREEYVKNFFRGKDEKGQFQLITLTGPKTSEGESGKEWKGYSPTSSGRSWSVPLRVRDELGIPPDAGIINTLELLEKAGRIVWSKNGIPRFKEYLHEMPGVPLQNIWTDIPPISSQSKERIGYQTQKPIALLERILLASSNEGDVVLDPFCGCGTAVHAAQKLKRDWIGIDITHLAINLIRNRLSDAFGITPEVEGEPTDVSGALALAEQDRFQFQAWALSLIKARPSASKVADHGIDGVIYNQKGQGKYYVGLVQVKSGNVKPSDIRDLRGVIEREKADYGVFLTLKEATRDMKVEAVEAGFLDTAWGDKIPKLQILTIQELLDGKRPEYPSFPDTYQKAEQEKRMLSRGGRAARLDSFDTSED